MAVAHVLAQATGSEVRSAMSLVDFDGEESFLSGTVIGVTVGTTDRNGDPVHVANVQAITSVAVQTGHQLLQALAEKIQNAVGGVAGSKAWHAMNGDNKEAVLHVEAQFSPSSPAVAVSLATPTFVPGV